jgi:hypothetical protein
VANNTRSERENARRARIEELRREQRAKERRRTLTVIAILGVVILIVVGLVAYSLVSSSDDRAGAPQIIPSTPVGPLTTQTRPITVPVPTGIDITGLVAYKTTPGKGTLTHDHVQGPVSYAITPPVGGPHNPNWMNAGVYTKPIPSERAVHDMEHGAVWITYKPSLPASQVQALTALVGRQSLIDESDGTGIAGQENRFMDLSPWADNQLPKPIMITAWGFQLGVDKASDPRLQAFIDAFRHSQKYTPEYGSPVDGTPVQTGGRAEEFGGTKPNPAGAVAG